LEKDYVRLKKHLYRYGYFAFKSERGDDLSQLFPSTRHRTTPPPHHLSLLRIARLRGQTKNGEKTPDITTTKFVYNTKKILQPFSVPTNLDKEM
jgi:hypothetical protein